MSDVDHHRLERLFQEALDLEGEEREAFLDHECGEDSHLRAVLSDLLRHDPTTPDLLFSRLTTRLSSPPPPRSIGPYRIVGKLGEGGFGEVYVAEQSEPVRREVALKILKAGMDTKAVLSRFEFERLALAIMDHPGIAKVFDAGETEQGRPYFVMELIRGEPIHRFCDEHGTSILGRLELFMQVCHAVQHAHQKGIIHRDLKPSNILVTLVDDQPVPRIIDFRVARATAHPLTGQTLLTVQGQMIGTPAYMSPEQGLGGGLDIDTRADIYSLGLLLYELLVGALPFDPHGLHALSPEDMRHVLWGTDPPRPSVRLTQMGGDGAEIARKRSTELRPLVRRLQEDLDWIVLKALEKDRVRRYETANALAQDVERSLRNEPVLAGPPSSSYRFRKFSQRHRVALGVSAAIVFGLVGAGAGLTWALLESNRARAEVEAALRESEAVTQFLEETLASANPALGRRDITVREVVDEAARSLSEDFAGRPEIAARLRHTMGVTVYSLGEYERSEELLLEALENRRALFGEESSETLETMNGLAEVYHEQGRLEEALPLHERVLEGRKLVLGDSHESTLESMNNLASLYDNLGRSEEAEALKRETLEVRRRVLGDDHRVTINSMNNLGVYLGRRGRYEEAQLLLVEATDRAKRELGLEDPTTLSTLSNLAMLYNVQDRLEEAESLSLEILELQRTILGPEHPKTLMTWSNLGLLYYRQDRFAEAGAVHRQVLEARRLVLGESHAHTLNSMNLLSGALREQGQVAEAERLARTAVEGARTTLPTDHRSQGFFARDLGRALTELGRYDEAERELLRAVSVLEAIYGADHERVDSAVELLVDLYERWGRPDAAQQWRERP